MMNIVKLQFCLYLISICLFFTHSSPVNYCEQNVTTEACQNHVTFYATKLYSKTNFIPYGYKHFDFCTVDEHEKTFGNFIQDVIYGKIIESPYNVNFLENAECALLCQKTYNLSNFDDLEVINTLKKGILHDYRHFWIADDTIAAWCRRTKSDRQSCSVDFPMGCYVNSVGEPSYTCLKFMFNKPDTFYLFNHVDILITYHSGEEDPWGDDFKRKGGRIVKVEVMPRSLKNQHEIGCSSEKNPMDIPNVFPIQESQMFTIEYTYSVKFVKNNAIKWSSRWDYLIFSNSWTSCLWQCAMFPFMTVFAVMILLTGAYFYRLRGDIEYCSQLESTTDATRIDGKCIFEDVFRPPQNKMLLSSFLGSGVQILVIIVVQLIYLFGVYLGFRSPFYSASFTTTTMVTFACTGFVAGYVSTMMYKGFGAVGVDWKSNAVLTSTLFPGFILVVLLLTNLLFWSNGSSDATTFIIVLALLLFWAMLVSLSTYVGCYFGWKRKVIEYPLQTYQIPRDFYQDTLYGICIYQTLPCVVGSSIAPVSTVMYPLLYMHAFLWSTWSFYMFGPYLSGFICLILVCIGNSILVCYLQLKVGNYQWWWRSFFSNGFSGFYIFLFCVLFHDISDSASLFLYIMYTLLGSFIFTLITGTIGFYSCLWFVRKMYGLNGKSKPSVWSNYLIPWDKRYKVGSTQEDYNNIRTLAVKLEKVKLPSDDSTVHSNMI